jgi:flagellar biosynthesis protein FlhG
MAARLPESTRTRDPLTAGRQRKMKRETAKPEVFASLFSRESLSMIGKISLDSRSIKPSLAQELVPPGKRSPPFRGVTPAPVFAITSGKGGVGKTNVVANLAAALTLRKKRVMVIDADLGLANLDLFFGVRPLYTLADFFAGLATLDQIIIPNGNGVLLLPGARGVQEITALRHDQKAALLTELDALNHDIDLVLVDTGSGISDAVTYFATSAQEIVVVVTPEPSSITDAYALIKVLALVHHEKRFRILANNVSCEAEARRLFDALSGMALRFLNASVDLFGWVPRDRQLMRAVARSQMVVTDAADAPSAKAFACIAERLIQMTSNRSRIKGHLQFFFRRMLEAAREAR